MRPQPIAVWTPYRLFSALMTTLLSLPRQARLVPAAIRVMKDRRA